MAASSPHAPGALRWLLRWLGRITLLLAALAVVTAFGLWLFVHEPPPKGGAKGAAADALARRIEVAVGLPAWRRVGAVQWRFAGKHSHLWDRQRGLVRVRWGKNEVQYRPSDQRGIVRQSGQRLRGVEAAKLIVDAHVRFINDRFWLNPFVTFFDRGVERRLLRGKDGALRLLVHYASGGVTPGDTYLWEVDSAGLPRRWQIWARILPIGGLATSWERWITLPGGARIATLHRALIDIELSDVRSAATVGVLSPGPDPFAALLRDLPASAPASTPAARPTTASPAPER